MTVPAKAPDLTRLTDLASERLGGRALAASDEFFAPAKNLVKAGDPVFIPDKYTDRGKWMDGWETRRRRGPGHDWCIVALGVPGVVYGVDVDTTHFRGNHPEACSLEACRVEDPSLRGPSADASADRTGDPATAPGRGDAMGATPTAPEVVWSEILPRTSLRPDSSNLFPNPRSQGPFSHLRLHIYPDGGVARLRVYGIPCPDWDRLLAAGGPVDLAAAAHGGLVLDCSDRAFGAPCNLLMPGRGAHMGDGWETRRRRGPGHDWCVIRLGCRGVIEAVEVDTHHFKGNYPDCCSLEVADLPAEDLRSLPVAGELEALLGAARRPVEWVEVLPQTKVEAHTLHRFEIGADLQRPCTHARFNIYPDGGVSRLRLYGRPVSETLAQP